MKKEKEKNQQKLTNRIKSDLLPKLVKRVVNEHYGTIHVAPLSIARRATRAQASSRRCKQ